MIRFNFINSILHNKHIVLSFAIIGTSERERNLFFIIFCPTYDFLCTICRYLAFSSLPSTLAQHKLSFIMKEVLNSGQIKRSLGKLYRDIRSSLPEKGNVAIIGIRTRGETIANRLYDKIQADFPKKFFPKLKLYSGVVDITFYRDDLAKRKGVPLVKATEIDFDIDNAWVILVDDILETGRSARAAIDAIHNYGRPSIVKLAVLIDRGGRELPIAADFTGRQLAVPYKDRIQLKLEENDGCEGAYTVRKQ